MFHYTSPWALTHSLTGWLIFFLLVITTHIYTNIYRVSVFFSLFFKCYLSLCNMQPGSLSVNIFSSLLLYTHVHLSICIWRQRGLPAGADWYFAILLVYKATRQQLFSVPLSYHSPFSLPSFYSNTILLHLALSFTSWLVFPCYYPLTISSPSHLFFNCISPVFLFIFNPLFLWSVGNCWLVDWSF